MSDDDLEETFELRLRGRKVDLVELANVVNEGLWAKTNAGEMTPPDHAMIHGLVLQLVDLVDLEAANEAMEDRLDTGDFLVGDSIEAELVELDPELATDGGTGVPTDYEKDEDFEAIVTTARTEIGAAEHALEQVIAYAENRDVEVLADVFRRIYGANPQAPVTDMESVTLIERCCRRFGRKTVRAAVVEAGWDPDRYGALHPVHEENSDRELRTDGGVDLDWPSILQRLNVVDGELRSVSCPECGYEGDQVYKARGGIAETWRCLECGAVILDGNEHGQLFVFGVFDRLVGRTDHAIATDGGRDTERITIRMPSQMLEDIERLVDLGYYVNRTAVIREGILDVIAKRSYGFSKDYDEAEKRYAIVGSGIEACPECKEPDIYYRVGQGNFRCLSCEHVFEEPIVRPDRRAIRLATDGGQDIDEIVATLQDADDALQTIEPDELDPDQYHVLKDAIANLHVLQDSVARSRGDPTERMQPPIGERVAADGGPF